jgi:hypothetical protein
MGAVRLTSPRYRVVLGDVDDPDTWTEVEVQAITRDLTTAEAVLFRQKLGKPQDSPIRFTAIAAWAALRRTGVIEGTWEQFEAGYLEIGEAGADAIPPTEPGADPGY